MAGTSEPHPSGRSSFLHSCWCVEAARHNSCAGVVAGVVDAVDAVAGAAGVADVVAVVCSCHSCHNLCRRARLEGAKQTNSDT